MEPNTLLDQAAKSPNISDDLQDKYQEILDRKETLEWNEIDKACALLQELLDDNEQRIDDETGAVIQNAISLIR